MKTLIFRILAQLGLNRAKSRVRWMQCEFRFQNRRFR
jgi:hypothetical protein